MGIITEVSPCAPEPPDGEFSGRIEEHVGGYNYLMAHALDAFGKVFRKDEAGHEYDRIGDIKQDKKGEGDEVALGAEKYTMGNKSEFKVDCKFTLSGQNVPESEKTKSGEKPMAKLNIHTNPRTP